MDRRRRLPLFLLIEVPGCCQPKCLKFSCRTGVVLLAMVMRSRQGHLGPLTGVHGDNETVWVILFISNNFIPPHPR